MQRGGCITTCLLGLFLLATVLRFVDRYPGWAISSHPGSGAPTSAEIAPIVQKEVRQVMSLHTFPIAQAAPSTPPASPDTRTYVAGQERFGTLNPYDSVSPGKYVAYWPLYQVGKTEYEKMTWSDHPYAYAFKDADGNWQATLSAPKDQTPWYRIW